MRLLRHQILERTYLATSYPCHLYVGFLTGYSFVQRRGIAGLCLGHARPSPSCDHVFCNHGEMTLYSPSIFLH